MRQHGKKTPRSRGVCVVIRAEKPAQMGFFQANTLEIDPQPADRKSPGQNAGQRKGEADSHRNQRRIARMAHPAIRSVGENFALAEVALELAR